MSLSTSPLLIHSASKTLSPAMLLSIHPFIHLQSIIHAPHHPFICLCNCSLIHSLTRSFVMDPLRCIHPHIPTPTPSMHPFAYPSLCVPINLLSIYLQIDLFVHQSICPSILLSLYSFFRHRLRTCNCHTLESWKFVLGGTQIKNSFLLLSQPRWLPSLKQRSIIGSRGVAWKIVLTWDPHIWTLLEKGR